MLGPDSRQTVVDTAGRAREELDRLGRIVDDLAAINRGYGRGKRARAGVRTRRLGSTSAADVGAGRRWVTIEPAPPVVLIGDEDG